MDERPEGREALEAKVAAQEKTIEALRRKVRSLQSQLNAHNRSAARRWQDQSDYIPYHEDDRD